MIYGSNTSLGPLPKGSAFDYCFSAVDTDPASPAFIDGVTGASLTRAQLRRDALTLAATWRQPSASSTAMLNKGDIIILFSPSHLLYPVILLAGFAAGTPVACSSSSQTPPELAHQIRLTKGDAKLFVVHASLLKIFEETMRLLGVDKREYRARVMVIGNGKDVGSASGWTFVEDILDGAPRAFQPEKFDGGDATSQVRRCS